MGIFWLSSQSDPVPRAPWFPCADKIGHAILYGGLAGLVYTGMRRSDKQYSEGALSYLPVVFASFYGLTDEVHQYFVPHRSFSVLDLVANAAGAWAVTWVLMRLRRKLAVHRS
jgi:VanZ family protein